jgi:hypothetical protein
MILTSPVPWNKALPAVGQHSQKTQKQKPSRR